MKYPPEKIRELREIHEISQFEAKRIYAHDFLIEQLNNANDINDLKIILKEIIDRILPDGPS
jgi:hypothetical protein